MNQTNVIDPSQQTIDPTPTSKKVFRNPLYTGIAGLAIGLVVGLGGSLIIGAILSATEEREAASIAANADLAIKEVFRDAIGECDADRSFAIVGDGGLTLTIDAKGGDDYQGLNNVDLWCIVLELGAPASAIAHMEQTTSMDGRQTESWDEIEVSWSYHPDRGMDSVWTIG